jgi:hypothetical protein
VDGPARTHARFQEVSHPALLFALVPRPEHRRAIERTGTFGLWVQPTKDRATLLRFGEPIGVLAQASTMLWDRMVSESLRWWRPSSVGIVIDNRDVVEDDGVVRFRALVCPSADSAPKGVECSKLELRSGVVCLSPTELMFAVESSTHGGYYWQVVLANGIDPGDDLVWGCSCPSRKLCSHIRRVVRPLAAVKAVRMENGVLRLASGDELRG